MTKSRASDAGNNSQRNKEFQQKSAKVIVVVQTSCDKNGEVSANNEGLNIELFQML